MITLDDNGFQSVTENDEAVYYRNNLVAGQVSMLYTTDTPVNIGGVKVDVLLKVSETATKIGMKLNISAQSVLDYPMNRIRAVVPGIFSQLPLYDDPHMEVIFDPDSDWSKVEDLDLIAEVRDMKRLQIGELPAGAGVRVTKGSIDDRPVGAGSISRSESEPKPESNSGKRVSPGATAGIAVGAAIFAGLVVAVVLLFVVPMFKGSSNEGVADNAEPYHAVSTYELQEKCH